MRIDGRSNNDIRSVKIVPNYLKSPMGSVLIEQGLTKVICCVSIKDGVPPFLRGSKSGWLNAEYAMLPCATSSRNARESTKGKQQGRSIEIQRIIGRSLRSVLDLSKIGERTLVVDCDVMEADGGTRTASITGAYVALAIAAKKMISQGIIEESPISKRVAALAVGVVDGEVIVDLNFEEDARADSDINLVMNDNGEIIEIQGTAEGSPYTLQDLNKMFKVALEGFGKLFDLQKKILDNIGEV